MLSYRSSCPSLRSSRPSYANISSSLGKVSHVDLQGIVVTGCPVAEANGEYSMELGTRGPARFVKNDAACRVVVDYREHAGRKMWVMAYATWACEQSIFARCPGSVMSALPPQGGIAPYWMTIEPTLGCWVQQPNMRIVFQSFTPVHRSPTPVRRTLTPRLQRGTDSGDIGRTRSFTPPPIRSAPSFGNSDSFPKTEIANVWDATHPKFPPSPLCKARDDEDDGTSSHSTGVDSFLTRLSTNSHSTGLDSLFTRASTCSSLCSSQVDGWECDLDAHLHILFDTIVGDGAESISMQVMAESYIIQREIPFLLKLVHDFVKPINRKTFKDVMLREAAGVLRVQVLRKKFDDLCRSRGWKNGQKLAVRRSDLSELVNVAFPNHGLDGDRIKAAASTDWVDGDEFAMLAADIMEYLQFRLSEVVGLTSLKSSLTAFCRGVILDKRRSEVAASAGEEFIPSKPRHMIFRGNPGTGKTTIARLVGDVLWKAGLVTTRAFVYVQREDLVGSAVGKTAQLTKGKIEEAQGGILFVDEAYRLFPKDSDEKDFGREAVEELMAAMLVDDGPLMIFAGYPKQMDVFIHSNPGLRSRIPNTFDFDDFTWLEMALILDQLVKKSGLRWADGVILSRTRAILKQATPAGALESMNGRLCELVLMFAKQHLDQRLAGFTDGDETNQLFELTLDDIRCGCTEVPRPSDPRVSHCVADESSQCLEDIQDPKEWLHARLSKMVGLEDLKEQIYLFYRGIALDRERAKQGHKVLRSDFNHMAFVGNPGTGKTSVARIMAELLQRCGLIESQKLVEVQREAFLGSGVVGSTEATTEEVVDSARGGVLFVDEAPRLSGDEAGRQVIQVIMSHMLERNAPIVIFAGPRAPMADFLRTDPGLASRIPYTFAFPDYTPPALAQIFRADVKKMGFDLSANVTDESLSSVFWKCGAEVRARTNGRLCQLASKFAKEALDADCEMQGTVSWELNFQHVASGVFRAQAMQAQVLGKIDFSQKNSPACRQNPEIDTAPALPEHNSDIDTDTMPKKTKCRWDRRGIQVKELTTETKHWMQGTHSESELLARIRSLDALMESAAASRVHSECMSKTEN